MRDSLLGVLALVMMAGCSVPRDAAWLDQLRAREATDDKVRMISSSDGAFAAEVGARLSGSVEPGPEADYAALSVGSDSPIECALYHDEVESASSLQTFSGDVFRELEERYGAAAEREVTELDAGVIGASPFLKLYWRYRIEREGGGEVLGELKQMIASREGRSVYCVHHENGYSETFDRVFRQLVGSLRFSAYDDLRPYFTQVDVLSAGGESFGFSVVTATLEEDGDPRIVRYTASLGRGERGVTARDVTEVEHSTVGGVLRNKLYTDYRNGEVASSLILEGADGVGWQVRGEREGEALEAVFEQDRLDSWIGRSRAFRYITLDPIERGRTFESQVWEPSLDIDASVARRSALEDVLENDRYAASVEVGERRSRAIVDRDGLTYRETRATDRGEVLQERVFSEGALR